MFSSSKQGSFFRTTIVPTIISAGVKENVIPTEARAILNSRLNPGDTKDSVEAYVKRVMRDPRIQVRAVPKTLIKDPSPISPTDEAFLFLGEMIEDLFPGALITPYLVIGATDARYFRDLTPNVYRFSPFSMTEEDLKQIHGSDESIKLEDYRRGVTFYRELIQEYGS